MHERARTYWCLEVANLSLLDNTGASSPLAEVMVALASCYLVHRLSSATNADSISCPSSDSGSIS